MTCSTARGSLPGVERFAWLRILPLGIDDAGSHLGPADIDADRQALAAQPQVRAEIVAGPVGSRSGQGPAAPGCGAAAQAGLPARCWCLHDSPFYSRAAIYQSGRDAG